MFSYVDTIYCVKIAKHNKVYWSVTDEQTNTRIMDEYVDMLSQR